LSGHVAITGNRDRWLFPRKERLNRDYGTVATPDRRYEFVADKRAAHEVPGKWLTAPTVNVSANVITLQGALR
jgi:hypothetical protein